MTDTEHPPVKVHLESASVSLTAEKRPEEIRVSHRTIVLNASVPFQMLAGNDPLRKHFRITVSDNPVVLSSAQGQATSKANTGDAALATPDGRLLPVSTNEYVIPGSDETWVSASAYPTRVSVTTVRCI